VRQLVQGLPALVAPVVVASLHGCADVDGRVVLLVTHGDGVLGREKAELLLNTLPDQKDAALKAAGGAGQCWHASPRLIRISGRQTKDPQHHCALLTQLMEK
jgi:hypothetical protein